MHYLQHSNYKLGKKLIIPLGILCSIGLSVCVGASASAATPSATITMGTMVGTNKMMPSHSNRTDNFFSIPITITVNNASAYTVSFWANHSNLCANDVCDIPGVKEIEAVTAGTSLKDMPVNQWGYRYKFGAVGITEDETADYKGMPQGQSNAVKVTTGVTYRGEDVTGALYGNASDTKSLVLGYGAAIDGTLPAAIYSNQVTVAVVMQPLEALTIFDIEEMQEMRSELCANTHDGKAPSNTATMYDDDGSRPGDTRYIPRTMLKDKRDGHWYIVSKLADGNCWMTENLALAGGTTITSSDSNLMPAGSGPNAAGTANAVTYTGSYTLPDSGTGFNTPSVEYMNNGDALTEENYSFSAGDNLAGYYNTLTHTGSYYSWLTATAGNLGAANTNQAIATEDICPKNWQLPLWTHFTKIYNGNPLGYNSNMDLIRGAFFGTLNDGVTMVYPGYMGVGGGMTYAGSLNSLWVNAGYNTNSAYYLNVGRTSAWNNGATRGWNCGINIRCIAK